MTGLFTLIIAILTVESSYIQNLERPAGKVPDTVQFWITPEVQWRIKTYSIDHDIHTYKLQNKKDGNPISDDFAINNIKKGYEDIIASLIVLKFHDPKDNFQYRPYQATLSSY